ncbi:MAG: glutamine--tRNA ligase/YqeY domain fusion protein [Verrucomicrobiota bacterium]
MAEESKTEASNFIFEIIKQDIADKVNGGNIQTRFPPEPNGYLHIGHTKALCLSFGAAEKFSGKCNLRFDDTNPEKEETEFVQAIKDDITWLGFEWAKECYASNYFEQLYSWALQLIKKGLAYVDDLTAEEMAEYRGTVTNPGKNSPHRDRSMQENLDLFQQMREGKFPDGSKTLRAKIDMASPNMHFRDPVMYRIKRQHHHRTGDRWCIYPSYDYAHGQSDSLEEVTHSLCSHEFETHRPLYAWFIEQLEIFPSRQIEFARLNLTYTELSKRKLRRLIEEGVVSGWDDPRMPTLRAMRRRGVPPQAIKNFVNRVGVTKYIGWTDIALLEHEMRNVLNQKATRRMVVFDPLKVVITNIPEGDTKTLKIPNNPEDPEDGDREVIFGRTVYIERADFLEDAPRKFFRLKPEGEVRLRGSYVIKCEEIIKDEAGQITELRCAADLETLGQNPQGRKVKGVIHWVHDDSSVPITVNLYDLLFKEEKPTDDKDLLEQLSENSLQTVEAVAEGALAEATVEKYYQFERIGYFVMDLQSKAEKKVFNRTVALKDRWNKKF